jgi:hypothetical protein
VLFRSDPARGASPTAFHALALFFNSECVGCEFSVGLFFYGFVWAESFVLGTIPPGVRPNVIKLRLRRSERHKR